MLRKGDSARGKEWLLRSFSEAAKPLKQLNQFKVWQDGNHPIEIEGNEMIGRPLRYIHHNPVVAGLVSEAEHWCYSSALDYAGGEGYLKVELLE